MKKLTAIILTVIMMFSFAACSGAGKDDDPNLIKIGDYQAVYKGSEIVKNSDGNDALVATYDYTNNSKEAQSFEWSMYYTVTQGDKELEYTTIFVSEDSFDTLDESARQDVAPGESLGCLISGNSVFAKMFPLNSDNAERILSKTANNTRY